MTRAAHRGQPLLMLIGVVLGWTMLRVTFWEAPFHAVAPAVSPAAIPVLAGNEAATGKGGPASGPASAPVIRTGAPAPGPALFVPPQVLPAPLVPLADPVAKRLAADPAKALLPAPVIPAPISAPVPVRVAVGHNLLLLAGLSQMEVPPALLAYLRPAQGQPARPAAAPARVANRALSRWSADGWVMLRQGGSGPLLSAQPSYGRSQAGAVVRYRLAAQGPLQPQAYLRGALALSGARDREVAAGLSARPIPRLPLRLLAELRVADTPAGAKVRPAALVVSELPVVPLPLGARAEGYVQAGYVGGDVATGFVDGQARVDRPLARVQGAELSAGAAVWGGAQKGAARLDIGPSASVTFRIGDTRSRLAVDYRFRVAGDAQPASGPALTLSAGF